MEMGKKCPECGAYCESDAVICVRCGINLKTGMKMAPVSTFDIEGELTSGERALVWLHDWVPGLLRPLVLIISIVTGAAGLGIMALSLFLLGLGAAISAFTVGAVGLIVWAQGIGWIMNGEFWLLTDILVEFDGKRWTVFFVLVIMPLVVAFGLAKHIVEKESRKGALERVLPVERLPRQRAQRPGLQPREASPRRGLDDVPRNGYAQGESSVPNPLPARPRPSGTGVCYCTSDPRWTSL